MSVPRSKNASLESCCAVDPEVEGLAHRGIRLRALTSQLRIRSGEERRLRDAGVGEVGVLLDVALEVRDRGGRVLDVPGQPLVGRGLVSNVVIAQRPSIPAGPPPSSSGSRAAAFR